MKTKKMNKLIKHFDFYFEQNDCMVIHPIVDDGFHIDVLLYKPTEKYPFWKLVTCLQVVLLNKAELDKLMEIGPQAFSEYLYPQRDDTPHFLSQRHRTEKF